MMDKWKETIRVREYDDYDREHLQNAVDILRGEHHEKPIILDTINSVRMYNKANPVTFNERNHPLLHAAAAIFICTPLFIPFFFVEDNIWGIIALVGVLISLCSKDSREEWKNFFFGKDCERVKVINDVITFPVSLHEMHLIVIDMDEETVQHTRDIASQHSMNGYYDTVEMKYVEHEPEPELVKCDSQENLLVIFFHAITAYCAPWENPYADMVIDAAVEYVSTQKIDPQSQEEKKAQDLKLDILSRGIAQNYAKMMDCYFIYQSIYDEYMSSVRHIDYAQGGYPQEESSIMSVSKIEMEAYNWARTLGVEHSEDSMNESSRTM